MKYLIQVSQFWNWKDLFIFHNSHILYTINLEASISFILNFNFYLIRLIFLLSPPVTEIQRLVQLTDQELKFYLVITIDHHFFEILLINPQLSSLIFKYNYPYLKVNFQNVIIVLIILILIASFKSKLHPISLCSS